MNVFNIIGGSIYQWDIGRKLKINLPEEITADEVHFAHDDNMEALVLRIYTENNELLVDIPNILIQSSKVIKVWLVNENQTICGTRIFVTQRAKPSDYVYTETEVLRYETLEKRIEALEKGGGAVNGVQLDPELKDNTKAAPASAVGELKNDITAVNNTTETPVSAGKVWTSTENGAAWADQQAGESGGGLPTNPVQWPDWTADEQAMARKRMGCKSIGRWKKIKTIVVPSDLSSDDSDVIWSANSDGNVYGIYFNTDDDGNAFNLTDGKIHFVVYKGDSASAITNESSRILIGVNATVSQNMGFIFFPYINETKITLWDVDWVCDSTRENGKPSSVCSARYSDNQSILNGIGYYSNYSYKFFGNSVILNEGNIEDFSKIESIKIQTISNAVFFNAGVSVDVWWEEY